jgi:hypothetical protein
MLKWVLALMVIASTTFAILSAMQLRGVDDQADNVQADDETRTQDPVETERRRRVGEGQFWHRAAPGAWAIITGAFLLVLVVWIFLGRRRGRTTRLEAVGSLTRPSSKE